MSIRLTPELRGYPVDAKVRSRASRATCRRFRRFERALGDLLV